MMRVHAELEVERIEVDRGVALAALLEAARWSPELADLWQALRAADERLALAKRAMRERGGA